MDHLWVDIAKLKVQVLARPVLLQMAAPLFAGYQTTPGAPDLVVRIDDSWPCAPPAQSLPPPIVASCTNGRHYFERDDFELVLSQGAPAEAVCHCRPSPILVEQTVRLAITTLLPERGALPLHASAVACRGRGHVFAGVSGSGKSTAIRLLSDIPGVRSLGDEIVVVSLHAGVPLVMSTPFGGELGLVPPAEAQLARLFLLGHDDGPMRSVAGRATALLRSVATYGGTTNLAEAILKNTQLLVSTVDCRALHHPTRDQLERELADQSPPSRH